MLDADSESSFGDLLVSNSHTEAEYIANKEAEDTAYLIKYADPKGLARLYLDLAEYISVKEKHRMVKSMKRQLGYSPLSAESDELNQPTLKGTK
jgi:hypothetical protein